MCQLCTLQERYLKLPIFYWKIGGLTIDSLMMGTLMSQILNFIYMHSWVLSHFRTTQLLVVWVIAMLKYRIKLMGEARIYWMLVLDPLVELDYHSNPCNHNLWVLVNLIANQLRQDKFPKELTCKLKQVKRIQETSFKELDNSNQIQLKLTIIALTTKLLIKMKELIQKPLIGLLDSHPIHLSRIRSLFLDFMNKIHLFKIRYRSQISTNQWVCLSTQGFLRQWEILMRTYLWGLSQVSLLSPVDLLE